MDRKAAVVVLLAWSIGSAVLLNGCGKKPAAPPAGGSEAAPAETSIAQTEGGDPDGGLQSAKEKRLVQLFRGLLLMDKKPELAIQKAQAELLLPLIRKSGGSGEISAAEMRSIFDLLTKEQRAFFTDAADRLKQGGEGGSGKSADRLRNMSDEEREKMLSELRKRREAENRGMPAAGRQNNQDISPADSFADDDWPTGEESVEQQLIELLEARAK